LEAQPAQDESEVSLRICSRDIADHLLSGIANFQLPIEKLPNRKSAIAIRK
jgi:hypothetical protein